MNIPKIYNEKTDSGDETNVTDTFCEKLIDTEPQSMRMSC